MKTLSEVLARDGVTLTHTSDVIDQSRVFRGVFQCEGRTMEHIWVQYIGNHDTAPSAASVLGPAIRFAQTAEAADGYEDWASGFSLDSGDWMPRADYERWLTIARDLRGMLGDERYLSYSSDLVEHE